MNFLFIDTGSQRSPLIMVSVSPEFACKLWLSKRFCERAGRFCARVRRPDGEKTRDGGLGPTAVTMICMAVASAHADPFRTLRRRTRIMLMKQTRLRSALIVSVAGSLITIKCGQGH